MKQPVVSINCITYNHVEYVAQCLDGFLMQKTEYPFEILVHDDASTDGTQEIILDYARKYPDIIKPFFQEENQYSKGKGFVGLEINNKRALGKYIALCEGDDYWTDEFKLQKQVEWLEFHKEYSMCFHSAIIHWEDNREPDKIFCQIENREYTGVEIFLQWKVATASVMFKREVIQTDLYNSVLTDNKFIYGDITLFLTCANFGKIYGISDVMSVYRKQNGGMIYNYSIERQRKYAFHVLEIHKIFGEKYKRISLDLFFDNAIEVFLNLRGNGIIDYQLFFMIVNYAPLRLLIFIYTLMKRKFNKISII